MSIAGIDKQVIAVDVAKPAVLLIKVLINRLAVLVNWHWLASQRVGLLKVVLAAEAVGATDGHLHLFIDKVDPAAHEAHLLLCADVVQPLHDEVFFVLEVACAVAEELVELVPRL